MKKITKFTIVLLCVFLLFSGCEKTCPEGYKGKNCKEVITPKKITITKIQITKFPATKSNGSSWDLAGGSADIYPELYSGSTLIWTSPVYIENANPNSTHTFTPTGLALTNITSFYTFKLYDQDATTDELIFSNIFKPYNNTLRDIVEITTDTYSFKLYVKYSW